MNITLDMHDSIYCTDPMTRLSGSSAQTGDSLRADCFQSAKSDRILVVDDMVDNLLLMQLLLESEGYDVEVASDGYSAIARVEEDPPSLIVLDFMMPEVSGYEVAERIQQKQHLCQIPILLVTGYDIQSLPSSTSARIDGVLSKPVNLDLLLQQVKGHLTPA